MGELTVILVLTAFVLGYASLLLYIRLFSLGVASRRVIGVLVELWVVFALIIFTLWLSSRLIGRIPRDTVLAEIGYVVHAIQALSAGQQVVFVGGLALAIALFAHLVYTLHRLQRGGAGSSPHAHGD